MDQKIDSDSEDDEPQGKGSRDFVVQKLVFEEPNTCYKLERWQTPDEKYLTGKLPKNNNNQHFCPKLKSSIFYQHHHCQTTQPLLLEQLREWDIDISSGPISY
jgi:hypothetical protein